MAGGMCPKIGRVARSCAWLQVMLYGRREQYTETLMLKQHFFYLIFLLMYSKKKFHLNLDFQRPTINLFWALNLNYRALCNKL